MSFCRGTPAPAPRHRSRRTAVPGRAGSGPDGPEVRPAGTRSITPKRRGSLNTTAFPDDMWKTTWSWGRILPAWPRSGRRAASRSTRNESGHAQVHQQRLAGRQRRQQIFRAPGQCDDRWPVSRSTKCRGNGRRRSGRRRSTALIRARTMPARSAGGPTRPPGVRALEQFSIVRSVRLN